MKSDSETLVGLPVVRHPNFAFKDVPRDWYGNEPELTCFVNALHLFIPDGENFFVRTILDSSQSTIDQGLRLQVQRFAGQEASHSLLHREYQLMLVMQGYEIESWLTWYQNLAYKRMESTRSPLLNLSITVALEHLISSLGEWILKPGHSLGDRADPTMAALFRWHAAEEIEHKSVAFDVFQNISGNIFIRWAGMIIASGEILCFWLSASQHLMRQDARITIRSILACWSRNHELNLVVPHLLHAAWSYLWPGFHPAKIDNNKLASNWLKSESMKSTMTGTKSKAINQTKQGVACHLDG